jgi:hypothetical protein
MMSLTYMAVTLTASCFVGGTPLPEFGAPEHTSKSETAQNSLLASREEYLWIPQVLQKRQTPEPKVWLDRDYTPNGLRASN